MDCRQFQDSLFAWIDGELHGPDATAAAAHEADCSECAANADAERAFEARTRTALTAGAPALDVAAVLRRARPRPAGRLLRMRRAISSVAGVAAVFLGLAWFNCVPPFECAYLQAVERAAHTEPGSMLPDELPTDTYEACLVPPGRLAEYERLGGLERVAVRYGREAPAVRVQYATDGEPGEPVVVVWCEQVGEIPSFRRREWRDGKGWWVAEENGRKLVSYMCAKTNSLVTVTGDLQVEELFGMAAELRNASHDEPPR